MYHETFDKSAYANNIGLSTSNQIKNPLECSKSVRMEKIAYQNPIEMY